MLHVDSILHAFKAERARQQLVEGFSIEHDDGHIQGELALVAACYAVEHVEESLYRAIDWPWDMKAWKPKNPAANLVRAGALIMAELERIMREEDKELGGVHLRRCAQCGWYELDANAMMCSHCSNVFTSA